MSNLSIQSTSAFSPIVSKPAQPAAQAAQPADTLVTATKLDTVSLSAQAKQPSRGLNLRESAVAAGMAAVPAAGLALMHNNRAAGIGYGLGLSAGVGLAYVDLGNSKANVAKNVVAGAVIGGSLAGTASNQLLLKTLLGPRVKYAVAVGAAAGAGVAIYREVTKK